MTSARVGSSPTTVDQRPPRTGGLAMGLLRTARPKQWAKNVLVVAAPGAAGVLSTGTAFLHTFIAFVAFCLAASGTYFINDASDVRADRDHPRKRHRPVAAGTVPVPLAVGVGATLIVAAILISFATGSWRLPAVVAGYLLLTTSYTIWLKHEPVVDLVGVAAGFVLRALAGAAAVDVRVSSWFFIVASLGSLFMVAGKREAELRNQGAAARVTLETYSHDYLSYVRAMSSGAAIVAYCLWAFEAHHGANLFFFTLSIVPFALGILRYAMLVDAGSGESPEDLVLHDRHLQVFGALLALLLVLGIYVA